MLLGYLGVPQLSLLELRLASESLGASVAQLDTTTRALKVRYLRPEKKSFLSPIVPIYIESADLMQRSFRTLSKSKFKFLGLVSVSISELYELSIEPYRNGDSTFTAYDLKCILDSALAVTTHTVSVPRRVRDLSELTLRSVNKDSVLQKVQSCLYRIRDRRVRDNVQKQVYSFLAGVSGRPKTGILYMDAALQGELLDRFRKAVKRSDKTSIDEAAEEFRIDRFEIAFVLAKKKTLCGSSN